MAESVSSQTNGWIGGHVVMDITTKQRWGFRISSKPRESNKPLTKPTEMTDGNYWEFKINTPDGFFWKYFSEYDRVQILPTTENGWISSAYDPPEKGRYLSCASGGEWGVKYWDGDVWLSTWPVKMWKPVVLPDKDGDEDRYEVKFYPFHNEYVVRDNESNLEIAGFSRSRDAERLIKYLRNKE